MSVRNYTNTGQTSTLVSAIGATDTTATLNNYAGDPTPPFTASFARGTAAEEVVLVTAVSGSTVTITRGYDGTNAQAQGAGATFQEVVVAQDFREANTHVNATTGVHGLTGGLVGTTDAQTVSNKTLVSCSFTSPTFTGTATGGVLNLTTLTVSGASTLSGAVTLAGGATVPTGKDITLTDAPGVGTDAVNKTYADAQDATTLASAKAYADTKDAATLTSAQTYADGKVSDSGWVNFTSNAPTSTAGKRRLRNGVVTVNLNMAYASAIAQNFVLFNLPVGWRPVAPMTVICSSSAGAGTFAVFINTNGDVASAQAQTSPTQQIHFTFLIA